MGIRSWWDAQHVGHQRLSSAKTVAQFSRYDILVPWWARYNEELFVREAYRVNPLVREVIEFRCRVMASATMYAMREVEDGKERLSKGHWLQKLLRRPSDLYPTQTRWIRQIERQLCITGECFIFLGRSGRNMVGATQILPGSAIQVYPSKTGVKRYDYRPNGQTEPISIPPENMLFLRYDDPVDPLRGVSPLAAAWREIQTDNSMVDYRKAFFDNAAIPGGVLTTKLPANPDQLKQWSEDFSDKFSGARNSGKTPALAGGLEYQRAGATPKEIDFGQVGAIPEMRVCMAFGVDQRLIGTLLGMQTSNYSNYKEAVAQFWETTIVPEMQFLEDDLTVAFTQVDDDNFCEFDVSRVPGLLAQREQEQAIAKDALANGAIMVNEYRRQCGWNPVDDGNVYYRPGTYTPIPEGELDVKPPDPMEILEKQGENAMNLADKQQANAQAAGANAAGNGKAPPKKNGRPAAKEADQKKAPQPGSANDRRSESEPPDDRLLKILDDLHAEATYHSLMQGPEWDRAIYASRVAGEVRTRLARIAKRNSSKVRVDVKALGEFLDVGSISLGNEAADLAERGEGYEQISDLALEYTRRAEALFRPLEESDDGQEESTLHSRPE